MSWPSKPQWKLIIRWVWPTADPLTREVQDTATSDASYRVDVGLAVRACWAHLSNFMLSHLVVDHHVVASLSCTIMGPHAVVNKNVPHAMALKKHNIFLNIGCRQPACPQCALRSCQNTETHTTHTHVHTTNQLYTVPTKDMFSTQPHTAHCPLPHELGNWYRGQ